MGNQCTNASDDQYYQSDNQNLNRIIDQDQFYQGQRPIVAQEHNKYNDDDFIDVQVQRRNSYYHQSQLQQNIMRRPRYILQDNVQLKLSYCNLTQPNTQGILVSIQTNDQKIQQQREGIDLVCLIDHSGSMAGQKMNLVKNSLNRLLTLLQPNDRLCLCEFDDQNYRLTRLMCVTQQNIYKFQIAIDCITAQGGTDIGKGMKMALSILKHRRYKNPIASIFLLSDGEDEGASRRVWEDIKQKNIKEPFTIFTFGFGRDCCPIIMSEIAHFKEGQFYFIPDISKIDECFVEALGGQASVIAYNISIVIKSLSNRGFIRKVYGDKWIFDQYQKTYTIYQPQMLFGIRKDYFLEMQVPLGVQDEQIIVSLFADSVETGEKFKIDQTLNVLPQVNIEQILYFEIMSHYFRVQAAELFKSSLNLCYNMQFQQAQQQLFQLQQQIYQMNLTDSQTRVVYADLYQAQRYCDQNKFNAEGRHYLTQLYMIHMYQQPRGVEIASYDQNVQIQCTYQNQLQRQYVAQVQQQKQMNPNYY